MPASEPCHYCRQHQGDCRTVPDESPGCCPLCGERMAPFSPEFLAKAAAMERIEARGFEDIDAWAESLASSLVRADAEEQRAGRGTKQALGARGRRIA